MREAQSPDHFTTEASFRPTLARPTSGADRWRNPTVWIRLHRHRLLRSMAAGVAASTATALVFVLGTAQASGHEPTVARSGTPTETPERRPADEADNTTAEDDPLADLPADNRILALERGRVPLPVTGNDRVELLGLVPTVDSMRAEMVATDVVVIGRTTEVVLLSVSAAEARRAAEIEAVGQLVVVGLSISAEASDGIERG